MSSLKDVVVIEAGTNLASSLTGTILADLGANVIKVESPKGDGRRSVGPEINGVSLFFASVNRNKKSVVLDLKKEKQREAFYKLVKRAKVLITNFRPPILKRLGYDFEKVIEINPNIIYATISGFGYDNPLSDGPADDATILSLSGLLDLTGEENRPPVKFATSIADITTAMMAVIMILYALYDGKSGLIDVPMLYTQHYLTLEDAYFLLNLGIEPKRSGSAHRFFVPWQVFETKDGYIYVTAFNDDMYARLCKAVNAEDLAKFNNSSLRFKNKDYIVKRLNEIFKTQTTEYWLKVLREHEVAASPVLTLKQSFETFGKDSIVKLSDGITYVKFPCKVNREELKIRNGAPKLGEHTVEVLKWLGYTDDEIKQILSS
ncbi:MAG: CaiB/BaiF CoA-transferase family protein [Sulfolobaceae archaeon]|nr:CaiB/BaiF CoA-transferase family protein [Sulfolobaceae archaeon]